MWNVRVYHLCGHCVENFCFVLLPMGHIWELEIVKYGAKVSGTCDARTAETNRKQKPAPTHPFHAGTILCRWKLRQLRVQKTFVPLACQCLWHCQHRQIICAPLLSFPQCIMLFSGRWVRTSPVSRGHCKAKGCSPTVVAYLLEYKSQSM